MIYAIIVFVVLCSFFVVGYYLNSKTPKPEGCENIDDGCSGCSITSCLKHPSNNKEEK